MKLLITGGAGFIGAHLAAALLKNDHQVTILDDFSPLLYSAALKQARLLHLVGNERQVVIVKGSILDLPQLHVVFSQGQFDAVFHFAAHANPGKSVQMPTLYHEVNVQGTKNVLQLAAEYSSGRVVFAGSSSVYDDTHVPFQEEAYPLSPKSPYGESKVLAEELCRAWYAKHHTPLTILRFFSVYGPWGRPDMAPLIFSYRILLGQKISVTHTARQRDFTYIDDIIAGTMATLNLPAGFEIINLGRGEPTDLRQLIAAIEEATHKKAQIEYRDDPPGEMRITYADITKAKQLLAFTPQVSVPTGVERLVAWVKGWQSKVSLLPS